MRLELKVSLSPFNRWYAKIHQIDFGNGNIYPRAKSLITTETESSASDVF